MTSDAPADPPDGTQLSRPSGLRDRLAKALGGRRFLRESAGYATSTAAEQGSKLLTGLVAAAMLGPETWGYWFLLNLVLAYGSLFHLGALNGMNREVPAARGRGDMEAVARLEAVTFGALLAALAAAAVVVTGLLAWPTFADAVAPGDALLMLGLLAAHQLYSYVIMRGRSHLRFGVVSRLQATFAVAHATLSLTGGWVWDLQGFIAGQAVAYLAAVTLATFTGVGLPRPRFDWSTTRELIGIGLPIMLVGVVHTFFTTADRWIVAAYLGAEALGHYSLAIMAIGAVRLLPQVFGQQIYPRMAFAWSARRDAAELRSLGRRQSLMTFATALLISLPGVLIAPSLVRWLLPEFTPGIGALLVVLATPLASSLAMGFGNVLNVIGKQGVYLAIIITATLVNVGVSLALVGSLGLVGVALGTVIGFLALSSSLLVVGRRQLARAAVAS